MSQALTFNEVTLTPILHNQQPWIRSAELAVALGYASEKSVSNLYARNADEFSNEMSVVINLMTGGNSTETRIFSLRGCHLLAMFARTEVAKAFRIWVLDVLESLNKKPVALPPAPDAPITPDQQCTLQAIVKGKVEAVPEAERSKGLYPQIWGRFNNHFRIASYKQLPQCRMSEAIAYLMALELRQKELPAAERKALPASPQPPAIQKPLPEYAPGSVEHTLLELDKLAECAFHAQNDTYRWANKMERTLSLLTGPLYHKVLHAVTGGNGVTEQGYMRLCSDRGVEALHSLKTCSLRRLHDAAVDITSSIRHAQYFAEALLLKSDPHHPLMEQRKQMGFARPWK